MGCLPTGLQFNIRCLLRGLQMGCLPRDVQVAYLPRDLQAGCLKIRGLPRGLQAGCLPKCLHCLPKVCIHKKCEPPGFCR